LARHDALLRDAVDAHGGQIVKGRGDGLHAVFTTADAASRAAPRQPAMFPRQPYRSAHRKLDDGRVTARRFARGC